MAFNDEILSEEMAEILRRKTPWEKLQIASGMWRFARDLITETLKGEHPDWNEEAIRREVARRISHGAV